MRHYSAVKKDNGYFVQHNETGEILHDQPLDASTAVNAARMMHDEDVAKVLQMKSDMAKNKMPMPKGGK